jgi:hypothetical protein
MNGYPVGGAAMKLVRHGGITTLALMALALPASAQPQRNPMAGFEVQAERALKEFVQIIGNDLTLTVPGQPAYTLVPVTQSRFRLSLPGSPVSDGFFLEFTADGATLEQPAPQPTLKLKRA